MTYTAAPRVDAYIDALPVWQQAVCRNDHPTPLPPPVAGEPTGDQSDQESAYFWLGATGNLDEASMRVQLWDEAAQCRADYRIKRPSTNGCLPPQKERRYPSAIWELVSDKLFLRFGCLGGLWPAEPHVVFL